MFTVTQVRMPSYAACTMSLPDSSLRLGAFVREPANIVIVEYVCIYSLCAK